MTAADSRPGSVAAPDGNGGTGANRADVARVSLRGLSKRYKSSRGTVDALVDVDLDVFDGELLAIIGPSGCGKSTLLKILAGLDQSSKGSVLWRDPPRPGKDIGFVFQEPVLMPWRNVLRNAGIALEVQGVPRAEANERVRRLLELVGLSGFEAALPRELSGGMRQRVAIVRALASDPVVLLMDEPFGSLDYLTRERMNDDLLEIWAQTRKTLVIVTHSVDEATYLADRVVVMSPRPGRIQAIHDVPLARPRNKETRLDPVFASFMEQLREELT